MVEVVLSRVYSEEGLYHLALLADDIWHQHFATILSMDQIDYMLEKFQSVKSMTKQMINDGYEYYFISVNGEKVGYTGIKKDGNKLFLSKLYLQEKHRGKGYASSVFEQLILLARKQNLTSIWLTVNRYNEDTIAIYQKKGFTTIRTQVTDIGGGFVMDDYVMELNI